MRVQITRRAKIEPRSTQVEAKSTKVEAETKAAEPREQYEYTTTIMDADADLTGWGEDGWILCGPPLPRFPNDPSSKQAVFYFRRKK